MMPTFEGESLAVTRREVAAAARQLRWALRVTLPRSDYSNTHVRKHIATELSRAWNRGHVAILAVPGGESVRLGDIRFVPVAPLPL